MLRRLWNDTKQNRPNDLKKSPLIFLVKAMLPDYKEEHEG